MAFTPVYELCRGNTFLSPVTVKFRSLARIESISQTVAVITVCYRHILCIFLHYFLIACICRALEDLAVIIKTCLCNCRPEITIFTRNSNMLCCIPADTVNTKVFQLINIICNDLLNIFVLAVDILHADITLSNLLTVIIACDLTVCMPVFLITEISLDFFVVTCKMVCNNVNNNLYSIFICLLAKICKLFLCAEVCADCKAERLIQPVP